jgi:hypothetical protein
MPVVLLFVCLGPVTGQQRLSIDCEDAALPEVVRMLTGAGGLQITGADAADAATPRVTLKLTGVTVEEALAEACKQAGWHYERTEQGYRLTPGPQQDRPNVCRVGDYTVVLEGLSVQRSLNVSLLKAEPHTTLTHRLTLSLTVGSDDEEKMVAVAGFDAQVTAVTDTGVELRETRTRFTPMGYYGMEPVVRGSINLPPPTDEARSLARIEGDLILYAKVEKREFEFAIQEVGQTQEQDGVTLTLKAFDRETGALKIQVGVPRALDEQEGRTWFAQREGGPHARSGVPLPARTGLRAGEAGVPGHDPPRSVGTPHLCL